MRFDPPYLLQLIPGIAMHTIVTENRLSSIEFLPSLPPAVHRLLQHETCGGADAFNLYEVNNVGKPEPSKSKEYTGCYADNFGDRVMSNRVSDKNMTTDKCKSHCTGFSYYATQVQYGNCCLKQHSLI